MVIVEDEVLTAANISAEELRVEIAILLFQQHRLTAGKAARLAEVSAQEFEKLLLSRGIPRYEYRDEDLELDLKALEKMQQP